MSSPVTIQLTKAIRAHGEDVDQITFRELTTKDVIELGLPTLFIPGADGQSPGIELRQPIIARYISRLAAIPMNSVEQLTLRDHSACTSAIMSFFGMGDGDQPTN